MCFFQSYLEMSEIGLETPASKLSTLPGTVSSKEPPLFFSNEAATNYGIYTLYFLVIGLLLDYDSKRLT